MSMNEQSVLEFTQALASKSSVPGGGGASALAGALGIALGSMVGNFTLGKKKYAAVEPLILALMEQAQQLQEQLLECVDEDAVAFQPLSQAYGIPKDDPSRAVILEYCLHDAVAVPMKIVELACKAILLHKEFADKGSAMMVSDAGTGVALCLAALRGAALNVKVNTKLMTDREHAEMLNERVDARLVQYEKIANEVYASVYGRF